MAKAGSKIKDDKQEYQYTIPWVTPSGHEFTFYDTPDNERLVLKHSSGSRLEFQADGSVFLTPHKDFHQHSSIVSSEGAEAKPADMSNLRYDTDLNLIVQGRLSIKCASLDMEVGESAKCYAGTDFTIQGNNIIEKATESIALEGTKSIYVDTKEYRERSVTHKVEEGTMEDGGQGGISVLNVHGNAVIQNNDETGGITISSKGYLSLVAGKERVDLVGTWTDEPGQEAIGTFTQIVKQPQPAGREDKSQMPGDYVFQSDGGASYTYAQMTGGSSESQQDGLKQTVTLGNMTQEVSAGERQRNVAMNETVQIGGIQRITAQKIFLN